MISNAQRDQPIAPLYDVLDPPFEGKRHRTLRPMLFAGMSSRPLDAGTGTNAR